MYLYGRGGRKKVAPTSVSTCELSKRISERQFSSFQTIDIGLKVKLEPEDKVLKRDCT